MFPYTPEQQLMAKFAFVTYIGERLKSPQPAIAQQELELLRLGMKAIDLEPDWEIIWGPMLFRFRVTITGLYDNLIFVAKRGDGEYTIAVRGTNGAAIFDWLWEDFWVISQDAWSKVADVQPPSGLDPKISAATRLGLRKLLDGPAVPNVPGEKLNLVDFMRGELGNRTDKVTVNVTGHSLGGALAPTLALYLADTQGRAEGWDPNGTAEVRSFAFAGPTAGNADFATYTDQRLGLNAQRIVNPLDIVPDAWSHQGLERTKTIYDGIDHPVQPSLAERGLLDAVIWALEIGRYDYQQYHASGPGLFTLGELKNQEESSYLDQAGWQHVDGYENQLGISGVRCQLDVAYQGWCAGHPGVCPQ